MTRDDNAKTFEELAALYTVTPYMEFQWPPPHEQFEVTCKNHPSAEYGTKGPSRGLHFYKAPDGFHPLQECPCLVTDLVVLTEKLPAESSSKPE